MSFVEIISTLLIGPIKLVFDVIFSIAYRVIGHPGLAIIALSLAMNFLVLPLYRRADIMQEKEKDTELKLHDGVAHIKKVFTGDERMMILQTYYRQNNYSPLSALTGSISLLLEIPFFIAAYQYLSNLAVFNGVSFGPIADLGKPDGLLAVGAITINLLPIVMTGVNLISSYLFLKGYPVKTKIQLYAMALFFLVFLYDSPACLLFYWTLNNLFSLVKTILYKVKKPQRILKILAFICGIAAIGLGVVMPGSARRKVMVMALGVVLLLPAISKFIPFKIGGALEKEATPDKKVFIAGCLALTVLTGILIPSAFIGASPQEFIDIDYFVTPMWQIVSASCLACGTFLIWMGVFYWLASPKGKVIFEKLVWIANLVALVNYLFFGTHLGVMTSTLQYENGVSFKSSEMALNAVVLVLVIFAAHFIVTRWQKVLMPVLSTLIIALMVMGITNIASIQQRLDAVRFYYDSDFTYHESDEIIPLSKTGKNVIVFMIDRALGQDVPYIMKENPDLQAQFDGFTYYDNVISFGTCTNIGLPALVGGYEYTPVEMNRRADESLMEKHNEALKVMPVAFLNENFKVTVCDPAYANYQFIPDVSIYNDYPEINAYITEGKYYNFEYTKETIQKNKRDFFCLSIMKCSPLALQSLLYFDGNYNHSQDNAAASLTYTTPQLVSEDGATAHGVQNGFMRVYSTMTELPTMTRIDQEEENTFLFITNTTAHEVQLLQMPDYVPEQDVDNTGLFDPDSDNYVIDGRRLAMDTNEKIEHYHVNTAALMQLGKWFDYMREQGVYDNTRIILVADHGHGLDQIEDLQFGDGKSGDWFFPLLMVKDFGATGFETSHEFMTNADVPSLAMEGLIANPTNPFTGKAIDMSEKTAHDQIVSRSRKWETSINNGNQYLSDTWASIKDNIWDKANWNFSDKEAVLTENQLP